LKQSVELLKKRRIYESSYADESMSQCIFSPNRLHTKSLKNLRNPDEEEKQDPSQHPSNPSLLLPFSQIALLRKPLDKKHRKSTFYPENP
jgi:hypothetical protein